MEAADSPLVLVVRSADVGVRLDVFLARVPELPSRSRAKALVQQGRVLVDGRRTKPGAVLEPGQVVSVDLAPRPEDAAPAVDPGSWGYDLPVLYNDPLFVAVNKPAGLASHPPPNPRDVVPNVAALAEHRFGPLAPAAGEDRHGIVHRLDRETSGVMLLARTDPALLALQAQFRARTVRKEYRAVVFGVPRFDSDWIERRIDVHPKQADKMVIAQDGGKEASTFYEVVERFDGFAHVRCRPLTGRTHQIRVHLTSIGHSLVGDRVYVSRNAQHRELPDGAPDPGRHCLHARSLTVCHPHTGEELTFEAPLPRDFEVLLGWLRSARPARA